jgi:hypothetical protein
MRRQLVAATVVALVLNPVALDLSSSIPTAAAKTTCTPGYSPCIPKKSSDVDCYGGSGNGPRYTKRGVVYTVKRGYDVYRLDADHDGKGCERS